MRCGNKEYLQKLLHSIRARPAGERVVLNLNFKAQELMDFITEHADERGYVRMGCTVRKEDGKFGDNWTLWHDDWQPQRQTESQVKAGLSGAHQPEEDGPRF